jgi:catechol 2,3-dioxygenase-like lactoylglutathione lyase family enzyme
MHTNDFSRSTSLSIISIMNIIGPDELVFAVEDVAASSQYLIDYGLRPLDVTGSGGRFEALDGTAIGLRRCDRGPSSVEETVYGVADGAALEAIGAELSRDRDVKVASDGSISSVDDMGFALRFRRTARRPFEARPDLTNAPGSAPQRPVNEPGITPEMEVAPRTLSHVVLFVPDAAKAEAFYQRLGFRTTDRFIGAGPFMRPAGTLEHHTLFMIQAPLFMRGVEHFAFHVGSGTEVLLAGTRFEAKGYETFWGPGRHLFGSNWFWYFNSPLGCHVEYDADMDLHDDSWVARESPASADTSQLFLFSGRTKWFPAGGPPPKH